MKKIIYLFTLLMMVIQMANGQILLLPENYFMIDSVSGDLDKDSINELVVAYNIGDENEIDGNPRELIIYKSNNEKWIEWKRSSQALFGSKDGGMMGDPFGEMVITNGVLQISQSGGSSWKWGFTDKYRFQGGEFYLIGYTSLAGMLCEYWKNVDFNLSSGKLIVKKEFEKCDKEAQVIYKKENEIFFEKGLKITIQRRQEQEIKISSPIYGHDIYIANGKN